MSRLVAVDGGQSTLRLALVGVDGVHEASGFSYHDDDPAAATVDAVARAWSGVGCRGPVDRAVLGLSGLPTSTPARNALAAGVAAVLAAREVVLCVDNVTAHAGALPDGYGVAMTVGTGVGCLAVDAAAGVIHRVDGWGHLFGDDGSAFAIGRAGIAAVLRALDGRGARTELSASARRRYGQDLPQRLYASRTVVDDTARFAVAVVEAATGGDGVAARIVSDAGRALADTATAAVAAMPGTDPVPVASLGRLVATGGVLVDAYHEALALTCPRAVPVPAAGSALDGAMRLAAAPDPPAYRTHLHVYREPR